MKAAGAAALVAGATRGAGRGTALALGEAGATEADDVEALARRIDAEHGQLEVLVNNVWGGELLFDWNTPVWPSRR